MSIIRLSLCVFCLWLSSQQYFPLCPTSDAFISLSRRIYHIPVLVQDLVIHGCRLFLSLIISNCFIFSTAICLLWDFMADYTAWALLIDESRRTVTYRFFIRLHFGQLIIVISHLLITYIFV